MHQQRTKLLRFFLSTSDGFLMDLMQWFCLAGVCGFRELIGGRFQIREHDIHGRFVIAVEVEQFVEHVAAIKSTWMFEQGKRTSNALNSKVSSPFAVQIRASMLLCEQNPPFFPVEYLGSTCNFPGCLKSFFSATS